MAHQNSTSVTPESLASAKAAQAEERQRVFERTGLRIVDQAPITPPYIIRCPRCAAFSAVTRSEGRAYRALATHLVIAHVKREQ